MKNLLLFSVLAAILLTSCVSQKKYLALETSKNKLQQEISRLKRVERDCDELKEQMEDLKDEHADLTTERDNLAKRYANLEKANKDVVERYDQLLDQNSTILNSSSAEKKVLSEELAIKENQLNSKEKLLAKLEKELAVKREEMESLRKSLEDREARITSLNQQLDSQKSVLTDLKSRLSNALLGFSAADLTVTQKDGKVYVSMSQNLLFAKGSNVIDAKGKEAIQKVSAVLAQNSDIDINVEGHTDSDGTAERNWDLSVTRATAVVNIMTSNGIDPKRITASGRAFYVPVAPNDVESNKSKNRRTEIILSPRLNELFRLLNE
jgi:chemotaxis protein MotB